ncbi:MAG: Na(+)/H(+) antiporter subunit C [Actinomycetes bacterium]
MTPNLVLCLLAGVLFGCGVYLILARSISRALIGVILLGNGGNLLFLVASGPAGWAPIVGLAPESEMADPLPQAMVLTAIVITLGMTAFVLAMAHRSWQLSRSDMVEDDVEDVRITRKAERDDMRDSDFAVEGPGAHSALDELDLGDDTLDAVAVSNRRESS